ncbi:MAG: hypothetical protein A2X23_07370 [Chloroflexi bacterium GWC2_73_18]|nr:MAG: hypothetical protein A2X23_07370 [Chloroflexi bacterium GWC2_73_18]
MQVFGLPDSAATRKAVRFFRDRRIPLHVVDLRVRPIAPAELRRFAERLGARALLDEGGRAYRDAGLAWLRLDEAELIERLLAEPRLLRLPLVHRANRVTVGADEAGWRSLLAEPR